MKKIFLVAAFALSSLGLLQAQSAGGTFSSDSFVLDGELSIYLKNGEVLTGKYKIRGTEIKNPSNISYQDIDSIRMEKDLYEYVKVSKNKVYLLRVDGMPPYSYYKSDKLTFYQGRPLMRGGSYNSIGVYNAPYETSDYYMLKEGMDYAVSFSTRKFDNLVKKYFSDCPVLMDALNDRKKRKNITTYTIFEIYTNGCIDKYDLLNLK